MALACIAAPVQAAIFTVGGDVACTTSSLQAAIDTARDAPGPDLIRVSSNQTYTAQALRIGQQDLILEGGYANCAAAAPTGSTVISGLGGSAASVFTITGSGVRDLRRLGIIRGDASPLNGEGGGINFAGSGELVLTQVAINQNSAAFGGGINFRATRTDIPAALSIESGTTVSFNTAQISGGGIRIEGFPARLFMLRPQTAVFSNIARGINFATGLPEGGFGGGILALDAARVEIASTGFNSSAAIQDNEAVRGGGLAAIGNTNRGAPTIRLFRVDAENPPRVRGNRASATGGGIYLQQLDEGTIPEPRACLFGAHLEDNIAQNGAAAYVDADFGGLSTEGASLMTRRWAAFWSTQMCGGDHPEDFGGVRCARGSPCNVIRGNRAQTLAGVATDGAVVLAQSASELSLGDVSIEANTAHNLVRSFSTFATGPTALSNCLLAGNTVSGVLLRYSEEARLELLDCTIAGNTIGGTHVVQADNANGGSLVRSIIWQPGKRILSYPGGGASANITISRTLVSERTTLPDGPEYLNGDVRFNDPVISDWRLRISSAAVDGALEWVGDDRDLAGDPRDQRLLPPPNVRVRDAGAFERQLGDPYLVNGVFYGGTSQWINSLPAFATYDATRNDGSDGTGSLQILVPVEQVPVGTTRMHALSQCFNVPFPGTYRLTARGQANGGIHPDTPIVNWRMRQASINCIGTPNAEGNLFLPGGTSWNSPAVPADIVITPAQWNFQSTIEVRLDVGQNAGSPVATGLIARFDNVQLTLVAGQPQADFLFANGFE